MYFSFFHIQQGRLQTLLDRGVPMTFVVNGARNEIHRKCNTNKFVESPTCIINRERIKSVVGTRFVGKKKLNHSRTANDAIKGKKHKTNRINSFLFESKEENKTLRQKAIN